MTVAKSHKEQRKHDWRGVIAKICTVVYFTNGFHSIRIKKTIDRQNQPSKRPKAHSKICAESHTLRYTDRHTWTDRQTYRKINTESATYDLGNEMNSLRWKKIKNSDSFFLRVSQLLSSFFVFPPPGNPLTAMLIYSLCVRASDKLGMSFYQVFVTKKRPSCEFTNFWVVRFAWPYGYQLRGNLREPLNCFDSFCTLFSRHLKKISPTPSRASTQALTHTSTWHYCSAGKCVFP